MTEEKREAVVLRLVPPPRSTAKEILEATLAEDAAELQAVLVLGVKFDGGTVLRCSLSTEMEKQYLAAMGEAWARAHFQFERD